MAKRLAELGALQDAITNGETAPSRLGLAGYIRGLFLDWSASPYNPLTRLSARGRLLGYFWDNGAIGLSMDFTNQNFIVKDGTLKSKSFSEIVNFTRTSNATVTRSDGTIGYAPHNLLTFSEQFDNAAWATKTNVSVTANSTTAPDGTTTADKIEATASLATTFSRDVTSSGSSSGNTFSIYIKEGSGATAANLFLVRNVTTSTNLAVVSFNYSTGVITQTTGTGATRTIEANGWYRLSLPCSAGVNSGDTLRLYPCFTGSIETAGEFAYVWGAQLEIGSTATAYNSTTVKNLLGYSELFENAAWTKSNSFVQTNLLTYSEDFSNAGWTKIRASVTVDVVISPNGYQTADKLVEDATASNTHVLSRILGNPLAASTYTYSTYFKQDGRRYVQLMLIIDPAITNVRYAVMYDLQNGVLTTASSNSPTFTASSITSVGNGWYRCVITIGNPSGLRVDLNTFLSNVATANVNGANYTGDGISGVYIWGAQLVQGSVAGDYRRTDAAALPVYYPNHNGVVCAEKLVENISTGAHYVSIGGAIANGVQTLSVYAKAGERTQLALQASNVVVAYFNLSTGSVISGTGASIQSVGNGWYRCSVTATYGANVSNFVYTAASGAVSTTGNGTSGVYIFGAQLSDSASLDPYVLNAAAAPTAAAYYGARFDYNPVTLQPEGLLIEEQRANALLNSKLDGTALSTQAVTVGAVPWTLSFYGTGTVAITGTYTGSLVGTGAYPTRSTLTFTPTAGIILLTVTGDVQFAQLEAGAFATSYIPTAASQVTRTADVATIQGSNFYSWYNQNEGSVGVTSILSAKPAMAALGIYSIDDGTTSNAYPSFYDSAFYINSRVGGSGVFSSSSGSIATAETLYKQSFAYKTLSYSSYLDNVQLGTQLSGAIPLVNNIKIGAYNSKYTNGTIKSISYYPLRLSNDVLKGLTA